MIVDHRREPLLHHLVEQQPEGGGVQLALQVLDRAGSVAVQLLPEYLVELIENDGQRVLFLRGARPALRADAHGP